MTARIRLKKVAAAALQGLGVLPMLEKIALSSHCVVITYHRVTRPDDECVSMQDGMYVLPEIFEEHLRYFVKHFNPISLNEFVETLKSRRSFDRACLLTFDDGWLDNYRNAYPLLKTYGVPATVFLAADFVGTEKWFWPDRIAYLLAKMDPASDRLPFSGPAREVIDVYRTGGKNTAERLNAAIESLKGQSAYVIKAIIHDLCEGSGTTSFPSQRQTLNWEEVREMQKNGISFGSHTKTHAILTNIDSEQVLREELAGSKAIIEQETGQRARAFCFPNGNYNARLLKAVEDAGYDCAFLCERGPVAMGANPYMLPRVSLHNDISSNSALLAYRILSGCMRRSHA